MSYRHDQGATCVVGICDVCDRRWIAGDLDASRALARAHEIAVHPGATSARDALNTARYRSRRHA
ncbi:hypothetical protein ABRQ22_06720 [Cellulosimicrobium sp. ES-005]|uniref:Uncharacterized protein n=1 Tax=Cellulosimicrobium sp. ES-005 TaxID=3163031 RepID=A0AAU8G588_9MICO